VAWAEGAAESANGPAPEVDVVQACGSDHATFLKEMLDTGPVTAKVLYEWGDCVDGGKQVMLSGTVAAVHLGPTDDPITHPFGDDLGMDINLDPAFMPFSKTLAGKQSSESETQIHVEISAGFIPHLARNITPAPGQTYRQNADANLDPSGFQPGFDTPMIGDPILVMGQWIIDCGHNDFSTELHAISFLAWAHVDRETTTVRFYYNPYHDLQVYSTDASAVGAVGDTQRLGPASPFPKYLVQQVIALNDGSLDRVRALELIGATTISPADFRICTPGSGTGPFALAYDVVAHSGATVTFSNDDAVGCVNVHAALDAYTPPNAPVHTCVLPWSYLDSIVQSEVGSQVDVETTIAGYLSTPAAKARATLDPETSCGDALSGPAVSATPSGQSVRQDSTTQYPFYGVITVAPK
jgi:hypothetical protein